MSNDVDNKIDISKIPTEELVDDLRAAIYDYTGAEVAVRMGFIYLDDAVKARMDGNLKTRQIIVDELYRRKKEGLI